MKFTSELRDTTYQWDHTVINTQHQYSAVTCCSALLLSSRILHPSLVMLSSHNSKLPNDTRLLFQRLQGKSVRAYLCNIAIMQAAKNKKKHQC